MPSRRTLFAVAVSVALGASACGSSDRSDGSPTIAPGDTEAVSSASEGVEAFDYSTVDYDAPNVSSALRGNRDDDRWPPPLVDPDDIVSGGPPPDGIPPIDDPVFLAAADVGFLADDEAVVVVEVNGDARAYPIQIMIWHEIVNDEIGGVPVTVTYCPLCNSALAYDGRFGNRVLTFGTSGELYQSALVMYDRQTDSLWAHFTGQGIVGHYAGAELDLIPAQTLAFDEFRSRYPDGLVLSRDTGWSRPYGSNPYVGYDDDETNPISSFISQPIDERLAAKERVVGVVAEAGPIAVRLDDLTASGVVHVDDGDHDLVVFHRPGLASALEQGGIADGRDVGQTGAYIPIASDGTMLEFVVDGDRFVDDATGTSWDITGMAVDGPLAGEQLEAIPHLDTFWFSWATYRPGTLLIEP